MGNVSDFEQMRYYPGSRHPIPERKPVVYEQPDPDRWDAHPKVYKVKGEDVEFFTSGELAQALDGRATVTIRAWERKGIIPKATFHKPSDKPQGRRRLYSRAQVEGIVQIAKEEGIYSSDSRVKILTTNFTKRVTALFKELMA